jgi:endo-1,4-beta-mannosidase
LAVARHDGVRVIAVLANGWGTCEAPDATDTNGVGYRDITWYQTRYRHSTDEGGIVSYRSWVAQVVARYKDDPSVFAWQLVNEGNGGTNVRGTAPNFPCPSPSAANHVLTAWAGDVSTLVKSIDRNHLVSIGMLNNSCGTWQSDNTKISAVPNNDLCDYHDYGSVHSSVPSSLNYMVDQCRVIKRPVLITEEGISFGEAGGSVNSRGTLFLEKIAAQLKMPGVSGVMPWVWNGSKSSLDNQYEIKPGDPELKVEGALGTKF